MSSPIFHVVKGREDTPPPIRATSGSVGYDLHAADRCTIPGFGRVSMPVGYRVAWENVPEWRYCCIEPRSGLAIRHGVMGFHGTIDRDYTGELCAILFNLGNTPYVVERGSRVAQLVVSPFWVCDAPVKQPDAVRGPGGFGSTGE